MASKHKAVGRIAIIGLGCRYPDAKSPRELWENVLARRQSFRRMPDERLPLSEYGDSDKKAPDKTYGKRAAVIDGFDFDWARRRIPKQVFEQTDTTHWLALDVALQAVADAGYAPKDLPRDRTGVIVGNTLTGEQQRSHLLRGRWPFVRKTIRAAGLNKGLDSGTLEELVTETEEIYKSFFPAPNEDTLAGALANTIAGRVCNYMDLRGGGYTVDGACSSSLLSVATAANALCAGDLDVALAGGVDVSLDAFELVGFAKVGALSDSDMKVYDRGGNGFLPGEGCGFIVMKRLEDAERDGDYVYAVLNGWGVSSDGKGGITAPTADGQALALRRAYDRAGYSAHTLNFVEGHGTGTAVGDPIELKGISNTIDSFGEAQPHQCGVTSFKSLVGHTKAAAGIGGLLKAIAGVNRRVIPPTAGCDDPHEVFTAGAKNLYPVRTGATHNPETTLTAGVSAMGFGGINSHVTITSGAAPSMDLAPALDERALLASRQETELLAFSAESLAALTQQATSLLHVVAGMSVGELPDLAFELARKISPDDRARAAIVASSPEDLHKRLGTLLSAISNANSADAFSFTSPDRRVILTIGATSPRVGFLFPGQGSQRLNMARTLVERFGWAREFVKNADQWLEEVGTKPVSGFIFRDTDQDLTGEHQKAWLRELTQTEVAQPAICLASLLWFQFLERLGVRPFAVGGHSLGELTAFRAAGALDDKAVLQLAAVRGKLMGEVPADGSMASLVCAPDEARGLLERVDGYVVIANINSATQTVVSGDSAAVRATVELATNTGIRARELPVSAAFHSAHFNDTVTALRDAPVLRGTSTPTSARLYSTMTGSVLEGEINLADHFAEQVVQPVNFRAAVRVAADECDVLLEVGPGAVLSGLSNETAGIDGTLCLPLESKSGRDRDLNAALGYLFTRGAEINLPRLWDQRLIRRFKSTAELSFIENPCEKDLLGPNSAEDGLASEVDRPSSQKSNDPPITAVRPIGWKVARGPHETVRPSGTPSTPPYIDTRATLLDAVHKHTGFPVETLSDDLRMIDDLHMDSIKTVQVVVDVAIALGYAGDFDPADIANSTLGEIVQELDARIATANEGRSGSVSPTRAAEIAKHYPGWTRNFVMRWQEAPLPDAPEAFWKDRSVCVLDDGSKIATDLWEATRSRGADVAAVPASATVDVSASVVVAVLSDEAMGKDSKRRFENVTQLLASIAGGLPLSRSSDAPQTVVFVQRRAAQRGYLDWGYDGFAAALHLERKGLRFRVLTVDEVVDGEQLCAMIAREVETEARYDAARYFGKTRRISRPQVLAQNALTRRTKQLDASDVVLVTGGARGITAECSLALARQTGAHMVLAGSSPSPSDAPDGANSDEIARTLERFSAEGLSAEYHQCNLVDPDEVVRLVKAARGRTGRVSAVIHGAAINRPRRSHKVTAEEARDEIGPKLIGALNLFEALKNDPPAIFCAFTSVIGVTGMPNNAWYAFSNQALDRSLGMFASSNPNTDAVSMAFSVWQEVGMGANLGSVDALSSLGTDSISLEEGVRRFLDLFTRDPGERQVVVTGRLGGVDTWRPEFPALPKGTRFLEAVRFFEPGVELIARSRLNLDRDPYLADHRYKGSLLFPTVFGLEAMAQAVAYVLGRSELPALSVHDVRLKRPLLVDPDRGLNIEVDARVAEDDTDATAVDVAIRSEQTGFASDHFTARFVLGSRIDREAECRDPVVADTNIKPARDLYGPILFQGPRFQRIAQVRALDSDRCLFDAQESPESTFVLGDPYLRDAFLQSLQLCALPDQCLPVKIQRIDVADPNRTEVGQHACTAQILKRTDDAYVGSVVCTDTAGQILERFVDYHAKVTERRKNWPTAEELAERGARVAAKQQSENATSEPGWDGGAHYRDVPGYGPQKQMAFFYRFPLTAQDSTGPCGTLGFANLYRWAGKVRELSGINRPGGYSELMKMLASQDLTAATNYFDTRILGSPKPHDLIEARYWADEVTRSEVSTIYEWWRIPFPPETGRPELIAWSRMKISAVKVLEHGRVVPTEWPEFFFQFLNGMGPTVDAPTPEPNDDYDLGGAVFAVDPKSGAAPVLEDHIQTGLEDANVVGNIYFANYGVWQARARDRLLHGVARELVRDPMPAAFLHCVKTGTFHVREALPFDRIVVRTFVTRVYERGLRLELDYSRVEDDGSLTKLATGYHEAAWVSRAKDDALQVVGWPKAALGRVLDLIGAETQPEKAAG
jgi:enediyne polyketide synthase